MVAPSLLLDDTADERFDIAGPLLLLIGCWLAFCWPWLSGAYTIPWDAKAHFAPQVQFMAHAFARGELPLWNPYAFAGHPQIADPQAMIFSPPMVLLALLNAEPSLWAIDLTVFLVILAGGLGVLLYGRDLGWHWAAAALAALVFMFGASMAWRLQHFGQVMSLAYLPFALITLRRGLASGSGLWGAVWGAAAGVVASFILLGRDQVGLLACYVLILYVAMTLLSAPDRLAAIRRAVAPIAAGLIVGILLCGLPLVMTLLLAGQSNRPAIDFAGAGAGSYHPALALSALVPHLFGSAGEMALFWGPPSYTWTGTGLFLAQNMGIIYIGAIPLIVLIIAAVRGHLWQGEARFFCVALGLVGLYALGWYTPVFGLFYHLLPGVDLFRRPADATFLFGGMAALLIGHAADRLIADDPATAFNPRTSRRTHATSGSLVLTALLMIAGFLAAALTALVYQRVQQASLPLAIAALCFLLAGMTLGALRFLQPIRPVLAAALPVLFTAGDLALNNGPNGASALPARETAMLETAAPNETIRLIKQRLAETRSDTRRDRAELAGLGFHWPNASLSHGIEQTLGYNPVRLGVYSRATGAGDTVGLPDQRTFSPLMPGYRAELARLLGLSVIATGVPIHEIDRSLAPASLPLIARTREGYVYDNPGALPRVMFATQARQARFEDVLSSGRWPQVDFTATVLLEGAIDERPRGPGLVRFLAVGLNEVVIEVTSADGGYVVLNDPWHPWWQADIGGAPAQILKANVLFRAVFVPAGHHRVTMRFAPVSGVVRELMAGSRAASMAQDPPRSSAPVEQPAAKEL